MKKLFLVGMLFMAFWQSALAQQFDHNRFQTDFENSLYEEIVSKGREGKIQVDVKQCTYLVMKDAILHYGAFRFDAAYTDLVKDRFNNIRTPYKAKKVNNKFSSEELLAGIKSEVNTEDFRRLENFRISLDSAAIDLSGYVNSYYAMKIFVAKVGSTDPNVVREISTAYYYRRNGTPYIDKDIVQYCIREFRKDSIRIAEARQKAVKDSIRRIERRKAYVQDSIRVSRLTSKDLRLEDLDLYFTIGCTEKEFLNRIKGRVLHRSLYALEKNTVFYDGVFLSRETNLDFVVRFVIRDGHLDMIDRVGLADPLIAYPEYQWLRSIMGAGGNAEGNAVWRKFKELELRDRRK